MPKSPKPPVTEVYPGDRLFVKHPTLAAETVTVVNIAGQDGFRGKDSAGTIRSIRHQDVLGIASRPQEWILVDEGPDGCLLRDPVSGYQRYVAGRLVEEPKPEPMAKALQPFLPNGTLSMSYLVAQMLRPIPPMWPDFSKADVPAEKPLHRLVKKDHAESVKYQEIVGALGIRAAKHPFIREIHEQDDATDQVGDDEAHEDPVEPAKFRHGDFAIYQHDSVEHVGQIMSSARDGVTMRILPGIREQDIRHEALLRVATEKEIKAAMAKA